HFQQQGHILVVMRGPERSRHFEDNVFGNQCLVLTLAYPARVLDDPEVQDGTSKPLLKICQSLRRERLKNRRVPTAHVKICLGNDLWNVLLLQEEYRQGQVELSGKSEEKRIVGLFLLVPVHERPELGRQVADQVALALPYQAHQVDEG